MRPSPRRRGGNEAVSRHLASPAPEGDEAPTTMLPPALFESFLQLFLDDVKRNAGRTLLLGKFRIWIRGGLFPKPLSTPVAPVLIVLPGWGATSSDGVDDMEHLLSCFAPTALRTNHLQSPSTNEAEKRRQKRHLASKTRRRKVRIADPSGGRQHRSSLRGKRISKLPYPCENYDPFGRAVLPSSSSSILTIVDDISRMSGGSRTSSLSRSMSSPGKRTATPLMGRSLLTIRL
jgi:hypothetical protein